MSIAFPLGAKVRFTQERLSILTPRDRRGLAGRIGVVQTDGTLVKRPTVCFPADGAHLELRLFRMDQGHLELVESPPDNDIKPPVNPGASQADLAQATADAVAPALAGTGNLSQSELDKLFG
jgi:hypothetical protein